MEDTHTNSTHGYSEEIKGIGFLEAAGEERGGGAGGEQRVKGGVLLTSTTRKRSNGHLYILSVLYTNGMSHGMAH